MSLSMSSVTRSFEGLEDNKDRSKERLVFNLKLQETQQGHGLGSEFVESSLRGVVGRLLSN
jgi:hypothetical protein